MPQVSQLELFLVFEMYLTLKHFYIYWKNKMGQLIPELLLSAPILYPLRNISLQLSAGS